MKLPSCPEIKRFFPDFRAPVVRNFLILVYSILASGSLSIYKCAEYVPGEALFDSKYWRLLRFVRMKCAASFCQGVARLLLSMAPDACYLVMDRTNWHLGKEPINVLFLGLIVGERFYLPLLWEPLDKHGSSNEQERIDFIKRFLAIKPDSRRFLLLADREFVGRKWLRWLRSQGIELIIRLREGDYLDDLCASTGEIHTLNRFSKHVRRRGALSIRFKLEGYWFHYTAVPDRTVGGDVVYLLSSEANWFKAAQIYEKRWSIEVFFKQMKSDGFNMEGLRTRNPDRLSVLIAAASVAYLIALAEGFIQAKKRPIKVKRSNGMKWAAVSVFRYGYRWLNGKVRTLGQFICRVKRLLLLKKRRWTHAQLYEMGQSVQ